jgi:hypothetical protein
MKIKMDEIKKAIEGLRDSSYTIRKDKDGVFWLEDENNFSGEPFEQYLREFFKSRNQVISEVWTKWSELNTEDFDKWLHEQLMK